MRRAAFVCYHTSPLDLPGQGDSGGLNVYLHSLTAHLSRGGVPCDIFIRRTDDAMDDCVTLDHSVRVIPLDAGPARPLDKSKLGDYLGDFAVELAGRLIEKPYDIVHSHYWMSGIAALDAGGKVGLPVVHTAHTLARTRALPDGGDERIEAETALARNADLLIASTPHEAEVLESGYGGDPDRIAVIAPGVDHDRFVPDADARVAARKMLGVDDDGLLVLYIGRIQELKGPDLAVEALADLSLRAPELSGKVRLAVVGGASGPDGASTMERLHAVSRTMPDSRVVFLPPMPHAQIPDLYHAADVCIVPSRSESFGLVALEAHACGVPVVAAAVEGLGHVVRAGESGLLVERPDAALFSRALERVLVDDRLRSRLAAGAFAVAKEYSWGLAAAQHRLHYGALASGDVAMCC